MPRFLNRGRSYTIAPMPETPDWPCVHWLAADGTTFRWLPGEHLPEALSLSPPEKMANLHHCRSGGFCAFVAGYNAAGDRLYVYGTGDEPLWSVPTTGTLINVSLQLVSVVHENTVSSYATATGDHIATFSAMDAAGFPPRTLTMIGRGPHANFFLIAGDTELVATDLSGGIAWRMPYDGTDRGQLKLAQCERFAYQAGNSCVNFYRMCDGRHTTLPLVSDGRHRIILYALAELSVLVGVCRAGSRWVDSFEIYEAGSAPRAVACPFALAIGSFILRHSRMRYTVLTMCSEHCEVMISARTGKVLQVRPLISGAIMVWHPSLESCARREYAAVTAAVAAVDELADGAAVDELADGAAVDELADGAAVDAAAVGLVRAVLDGFVAEDARLTALQAGCGQA